jgi:hypothetical protein
MNRIECLDFFRPLRSLLSQCLREEGGQLVLHPKAGEDRIDLTSYLLARD